VFLDMVRRLVEERLWMMGCGLCSLLAVFCGDLKYVLKSLIVLEFRVLCLV